jgi:hypothetical protein
MRNFPCSVTVCLLLAAAAASSSAQTSTESSQTSTTTSTKSEVVEVRTLAPDLLVMSAGSVLVVRGKQTSRLETEVRLADNSVLTPGGTVRRPDGSSTMLSDGQAISAAGKIGDAPTGALTETTGTSVEIVPVAKP